MGNIVQNNLDETDDVKVPLLERNCCNCCCYYYGHFLLYIADYSGFVRGKFIFNSEHIWQHHGVEYSKG